MAGLAALWLAVPAALAHGPHESTPKRFEASEVEDTPFGRAADPRRATRTVPIVMDDRMRFTPATLVVKRGETLRFVVRNEGKVLHEMVLGTTEDIARHAELMRKFPDMEHDEPSKLSLAPGKQGEIIWQFTKAGVVNFACLMPGHYEAGMKGAVSVVKR